MGQYCESCSAPLTVPDFKGPAEQYCRYCTDASGRLHPREQIQQGIAKWLQSWQADLSEDKALQRATHYMRAMPAWAED